MISRSLVVSARIQGHLARVLIDSGCLGNFISPAFKEKHSIPYQNKRRSYQLVGFDNTPVRSNNGRVTEETSKLEVVVGTHRETMQFDITETSTYDATFGLPWLEKHEPDIAYKARTIQFDKCSCNSGTSAVEILPVSLAAMAAYQRRDPNSVLFALMTIPAKESGAVEIPSEYRGFQHLFEEAKGKEALPEHQPWDHEIPLVDGKAPGVQPIYSLSERELEALRKYIDENIAKGYIRASKSPARYPILFVPKKDGKLRMCVDYRKLNEMTIKNRYTLPLIHEMQDRIRGAKYFTRLDLREAYYKVRMKEGEEWKTAFGSRLGHFEYLVMPFGLTNAPATFQALINDILREYLDRSVVAYLDDILIYSKTKTDHVRHVTEVLEALGRSGMRIQGEKCVFHQPEVEFLGFILSTEGVKMDPSKVEAVQKWPRPQNVTEVQEFLGFANFYRRFIKGYSGMATPLTNLTKKDKAFLWTENEQFAFDELKRRFTVAPILAIFDPDRAIVVETDASDYAVGACISQIGDDGKLHPVAFYSRKMSPAEANYDIHDKELLAIVAAFQEWRVYLEGPKHTVKVLTDHKNLTYFTTTKKLNRRQVRWAELLASYNFQIHYQKGTDNGRADALSRRADHREGPEAVPYSILRKCPDGTLEYNHQIQVNSLTIVDDEWEKGLRESYKEDKMASTILAKPPRESRITVQDGIILVEGLIYVPQSLRRGIFEKYHNARTMGHQGTDRTLERMQRTYYFPNMRKYVEDRIRKCDPCNRNKAARHKPYGLLKSPEAPKGAWECVALDFIVKLPPSTEPMTGVVFDSILVVTDRLTKYGYFIPYKESSSAEELAYAFNRHIIGNHGIPKEIISDRDKLFTSRFWKSLVDQLGIHHKLSTGYHPQTDGQTERLNQTLEQYLRFYVDYKQTNWVSLLPTAQLAYNSAATATTGISPFYANYGYNPQATVHPRGIATEAQKAKLQAQELQKLHKELSRDIEFLAIRSADQYNKKRLEGPRLQEGDKVYLLRRNIETTRPSSKLDHKKFGPFRVKRNIRDISYELELPKTMRIHPVFHISLLEPADPDTPEGPAPELHPDTQQEEYEVEAILDVRLQRRQLRWLVKWVGYGNEENTWEPKENLRNCQSALDSFYQTNQTTLGRSQ
jgi:hypothetical protein